MSDEQELPKSKFSYGGRKLHEMSHADLIEAVDGIWEAKNEEIGKLKAERDGLKTLLTSSFPIHSLWRGFSENAFLFAAISMVAYLAGVSHGK